MRFKPTKWRSSAADHRRSGFTLVEALAALAFLGIVIPVAVQGIQLASRAGQVAVRKVTAARVAERVLNELIVTGQWKNSAANGTAAEGLSEFRWQLRSEAWQKDPLRLVTLKLTYAVQGLDYTVNLSTLLDGNQL